MRPFIIVTIQNESKHFIYDIEVPTTVPAGRLADDIKESLFAYNNKLKDVYFRGSLYCKRLDMTIPEGMTFQEAGIWSGDVITIS